MSQSQYVLFLKTRKILCTSLFCLIAACGSEDDSTAGGDTGSDTSTDTGGDATGDDPPSDPVSTADVLCDYSENGNQRLVYTAGRPGQNLTDVDETLPFNFSWECDSENRTLTGNGVPNHAVQNGAFTSQLTAQIVSYDFPIDPEVTEGLTEIKEPGYALNSVKFDPATAGTCPDNAADESDCNYAMGADSWSMVATAGNTSPWKFEFGVDENDAHVQPSGAYHYHGIPVALVEKINPNNETSMTLVGWAKDGFPMYSVEGYEDAQDGASAVIEVASSYQTVSESAAGRPSVTDFPLGHFIQDWEYVEGSGDLDACNGRYGVTPEFPEGIYHYYITRTYPFIQRCVRGASRADDGAGPPGGR